MDRGAVGGGCEDGEELRVEQLDQRCDSEVVVLILVHNDHDHEETSKLACWLPAACDCCK